MKFTWSAVVAAVALSSSSSTMTTNAFVPQQRRSGGVGSVKQQENERKGQWNARSQSPLVPAFGILPTDVTRRSTSYIAMSSSAVESKEEVAKKESFAFTSDVGRVMDLIINSLYSDKDIFLRELVSNAADACDKKRFLSLTSGNETPSSSSLPEIRIQANIENNTLMIEDTGVGMTKEELVNNLGRIAQSGTRAFVQALGEGTADVNLIGQFGVGFYSAYLVANKVEVVTKSMQPGSKVYRWTCEDVSGSSYTIEELDDNSEEAKSFDSSGSGTRLILHLKDESSEYLETSTIQDLLNRYSEYIEFPINLWKEKTEYVQVPDDEANKDLPEGETPKTKTVPQTKEAYELVNSNKPLWLRPPKDVTEAEYQDFYKSAFRSSYDTPMKWSHFVLEGQVECKALLYIPGMLPFELSRDMFDDNSRNLRLYVKRVFINDQFEDLMPRWLKFVRGVVDSNDLPLNVSREILQKSKVLSIINKRLVRKSLDMIRDIAAADQDEKEGDDAESDDTDDDKKNVYNTQFWKNFGKYLKVGVIEDDMNRKEIAPLLRFFSSDSGNEFTSLDEYVQKMPKKQKAIYYLTGDGLESVSMNPVLEKLKNKGYDVLFCTEPLDEIMMENLRSYKEFDLLNAAKENLKLDSGKDDEDGDGKEDDATKAEKEKKKQELQAQFKPLVEYLEPLLRSKVEKVIVSSDLVSSPAALVQGAYGMSPTMQRYMRAQAVGTGADADSLMGGRNKAVLEINPNHPIVQSLNRRLKADPASKESKELEERALLVYDVAAMTSGYDVSDLRGFAQRVIGLMGDNSKDDDDAAAEEQEDADGVKDAEIVAEDKE
ncbi:hypothetical protein ACA910_018765 [Epithemia clementina (nom. ined.)]